MPKVIELWETASLIPHRHPFLFASSVEVDASAGTKVGLKASAILPPESMGLWNTYPLPGGKVGFPPIFAIEIFAEIIGVAFLHVNADYRGKLGGLLTMENVILSPAPFQGLKVDSVVTIASIKGPFFKSRGQMCCGDRIIAVGDFTCGLLE